MALTGDLIVTVDSDSWFARVNMPYVVRNSRLAVVHQGTVGERIALSEGLYSVDVLSPSGAPTTSVVHVQPGATTHVQVPAPGAPPPPGSPGSDVAPEVWGAGARVTTVARPVEYNDVDFTRPPVEFEALEFNNCSGGAVAEAIFEIEPAAKLDRVPTAVFRLGTRRIEMSLPLNPVAHSPAERTCRVVAVQVRGEYRLGVVFSPQRDLITVMIGLLRHNTAYSAVGLMDTATDTLYEKYKDPAGAALGGLTLHNMGRLSERQSWIENLATDFRWLPDGQILCAALLTTSTDTTERNRGWFMLLSAADMRPLYTDGLSLAMELLRHWPDAHPEHGERVKKALQRLGSLAAHAEWDSITLSTRLQ
jgi:hypothetical protein